MKNQQLSSSQSSLPDVHPFFKDPAGRFVVLYTFVARDENDVTVERGEVVTVLNREDPDWFWIVRSDGQEGFIPSAFVYPAEDAQGKFIFFYARELPVFYTNYGIFCIRSS